MLDRLDGRPRVYVFDLDGTVYLGEQPIEGVPAAIESLRERGAEVFFLTNNSSAGREFYLERLEEMGIDVAPEQLVQSTDSVITTLQAEGVEQTYVLGTTAMRDTFRSHGIDPTSAEPTHVVVGFDTELTYEKVKRATLHLNDGAQFLGAHPDPVCPTPAGAIPDCGSIMALLETATGRCPDRVLGKPDPVMLDPVFERSGCDSEEVVIVGDRPTTDIRLANAAGVDSILVRTGDDGTTRSQEADSATEPTAVLDSAAEILDAHE